MRTSAVSNARWIAVSRGVAIAVQLGGVMWLSRLLSPADYGVVAMAARVEASAIGGVWRQFGVGAQLIADGEPRRQWSRSPASPCLVLSTAWVSR